MGDRDEAGPLTSQCGKEHAKEACIHLTWYVCLFEELAACKTPLDSDGGVWVYRQTGASGQANF